MCFTIFQNEKTPFYAIKTKSPKNRKIGIFPKGLTHGFGPKMAIFPTFFFRQYMPAKCLLRYSRTKYRLSRLEHQDFKKSKDWRFSKRVKLWFWSKNGHFSNFFFQAIQARKMCFTIFQNEKTPFYAIKRKKFKNSKNCHFSQGANPWFWSKDGHFCNIFFLAIQKRKMCFTIFQNEKTLFYAKKRRSS